PPCAEAPSFAPKLPRSEPVSLVPLRERLFRVFVEALVLAADVRLRPPCPRAEHHVYAVRRHRQFGIDGRGMRMNEIGPAGVVQPEGAAAVATEASFAAARAAVVHARPIDRQRFFA